MSAALFPRPCSVALRVARAFVLLNIAALPAAAQPSTNVGDNLGTFSVGEVQWALVANGGTGTCTWAVTAGGLPPGITLRTDVPSWSPPGTSAILMGIATTPGVYPFTLSASCDGLGTADQGTEMTITALTIADPHGLPDAYVGAPYTYTFTGFGNTGADTWAVDGTPPPGLELSTTGVLSGEPETPGYHNFGVTITADGHTVSRGFGLYIHGVMHITSALMANATRGASYSNQVQVTGGTGPYTFALTGGGLPFGLSMDSSGLITGTPDAGPGRYGFSVTATDATSATHGRALWVYVVATPASLPSIQPHGGMLDDCTIGVPCSMGLYVSNGGVPPFSWTVTGLPEGFWFRDSATNPNLAPGDVEIVGVGMTAGTSQIQVTVTGADSSHATQVFPLRVTPLALRTESTTSTEGVPFSAKLYVLGGTAPYSGVIAAGPLPAGLVFHAGSLTVSGTPLESGGFHVDFRMTDATEPAEHTIETSQHYQVNGVSGTTVNMHWDLGFVTTGWFYSTQLWACCASGGYTWSLENGALPDGMALADGQISGTPTVPGTYTFLVRATEIGNPTNTGARQLTLRVTPMAIVMDSRLTTGFTTTPYSVPLTVTGGTGAITWDVARYSYLPAGLTLTDGGVLNGTPAASGQYDFSLTATDEAGHTLTRGFNVSIYPFGVTPPVSINVGPNLGTWSVGDIHYGLWATGGDGTYAWSVVAGALPGGISLRADMPSWYGPGPSAALMGIATQPGVYTFTLRASSGDVHTDQVCTMMVTALRITDRWALPDAFVGGAYSFPLKADGNAGAVTWTAQQPLPPWLALSPAGVVSGTPTAAGYYRLNVSLTDGTDTIGRGIDLNVSVVRLTTEDLPGGTTNGPYSVQLTATGGTGSYTFTHHGGLPWGVTLSPGGLLSGTLATGPGRYAFTVYATDSVGQSHSRNFAIQVVGVPPTLPGFQEHGGSFDDCTVYVACSRGLFVWNGSMPPLEWEATGLPAGLSLATTPDAMSTGTTAGDAEIVGVPTTPGTDLIEVKVTDASGASATRFIPLNVSPMGLWSDNAPGTVGEAYSTGLYVLGGVGPYTGTIVSGKLPAGLSFDGVGRITGTPLENGGFHVRIRFTDANGATLLAGAHVNIGGGTSTITVNDHWDLGTVTTDGFYSRQLSACCAPAYTWNLVSGELPPGLTLSTTTGLLSGTVTTAGTYDFLVSAADTGNPTNVGVRALRLVVTPMSMPMNPTMQTGFVNTGYSVSLTAAGGTGAVTWTVAPFSYLPPGLALVQNGSAWTLSGTPLASGQYSFGLIAGDAAAHSMTMWFGVSIYPEGATPPVAITTGPDLGTWSVGEVQAALHAAGGNGTYAWTLVGGGLPPGISLRADVPPWFQPATAGLIGIATAPGPYTFTLRVTSGDKQFEQAFTVSVTGLRNGDTFALPDGFVNELYTYALRAEGVTGAASWMLDPGAPAWVTLGSAGALSGTPPAPGWYHIPFTLTDAASSIHTSVGLQVYDVHLTSGVLANGTQNAAYSDQVEAAGGIAPYTFELNGGLPNGLTMDAAGAISGTCNTGPGRYPFDVTVRDAAGSSHRRTLAIYVSDSPAQLPMVREHGIGLDDCTQYVPCQRGFWVQNGGTAPFMWTATGLPAGLSMGNATWWTPGDGAIIGTPTETGTFEVGITVTAANGASATQTFPLTVSPLALRPDSTNASFGEPFSTTLRVIGGTKPYTGTILAGELPAGLSFNGTTGVISGTPIDSSGTHVVFRFTDGGGQTVTAGWGTHISNGPGLWFNTGNDLGYVSTGSSYSNQLRACCAPGYTWSFVPGTLPPGLTLSQDGLLSGTPTTDGTYSFLMSVADATNPATVITRRFTLRVTPISVRWTGDGATGNVDTPYGVALEATGGTGDVTWTLAPFNYLPPGLALVPSGSAWTLSGTPSASGQYGFSLTATDSAGHTASLGFNVSIYPEGVTPPVRITQSPGLITRAIGDVEEPLVATGGDGTYTWQVLSGTLPPGLSLRARPDLAPWFSAETSGSVTGIATAPGTYHFTLRVTSGTSYADQACTVTITLLRGADHYTAPDAFVGRPYSYTLQAAGNAGPVTFTPTSTLPPGLEMTSAGLIRGTPGVSGYYHINYSMHDGVDTVGRWVDLSVFDVAITTPGQLPNATQYAAYSAQIEAAGGTGSHTFTADWLPSGLSLSAAGVLSGTINNWPGNLGFNVTATDANHVSYTRRMAITVVGVPKRLPAISPYGNSWHDCTYGVPCSLGVYVSGGGTAPFSWNASGLPEGLSIRSAGDAPNRWMTPGDGEITGVPAEMGLFNVEVSVTDADGAVTTNTFPLRVSRLMARDFDGNGTRGEPFEAYPFPAHYRRIRVTGGEYSGYPSYTSTIVSGQLPSGLVLDSNTQTVSGTPVENGSFGITLDVRDGADPANSLRTGVWFQIGGGTTTIGINNSDLGQAVIGQTFSYQLGACCIPTPYSWSVEPPSSLPAGLTLDSSGRIAGTPTGPAGAATFLVRATDSINEDNYGIRLLTLTLVPTAITIPMDTWLPFANVGKPYAQTLVATGGSGALTWTLEPNSYLPPGLSVSAGGLLSGTPTKTGQFSFGLRVTGTDGSFAVRTFTLEVYTAGQAPPLGLNIGTSYTSQLGVFTIQLTQTSASGGVGPYTFSLTPEAELPAGAAQIDGMRVQNGPPFPTYFSPSAIAGYMGVIAEPGEYHPSIRVTDSRGVSADRAISVTVLPIAILSSPTPPRPTVGAFYVFTLEPYGGSGNYAWSATNLPSGLSINATTGEISGPPAAGGTFFPSVTMTDLTTSTSTSMGLTLAVDPYAIETNGVLPPAVAGSAYSAMLVAPGCGPTCYWSITSGNLTNGLSLNPATGVISGTNPAGPDSRTFTVRAAASPGSATFAEKVFSMVTQHASYPALVVTGSVAPGDVTVGSVTSAGLFATGGTPPYTWTLDAGSLPPGITLVASAEQYSALYGPGMYYLRGRAMVAGTYTFTLRVTDYAGATATKTVAWNVSRLSFQYTNLPVGSTPLRYDEFYAQPLLVLGGTGEYPTWTSLTAMPSGLSVAADAGVVSGTPRATGWFNTTVRATDSAGNTFTQWVNFNIAGPTPTLLTFPYVSTMLTPSMGSPVSYNVTPSGGAGPYTVTAVTPLPAGFTIVRAEDGVLGGPGSGVSLMGVATSPTPFTFTLEARDSAMPIPNVGARTFTLSPMPFNTLVGSSLPDASTGAAFSQPLLAFDNTGTPTWSVASGSALPPGLSLLSGNTISGSPTLAGLYSFALIVSDQSGLTTTRNFSLKVSPIAIAGSNVLPAVTTGVPYSYTFTATGGSGPLTWSLTSGTLPSGLTLSSTGVLSGTRTSGSGSAALMITAADGTSSVTRRVLLPSVLPNPAVLSVALSGAALTDAIVGQNVSFIVSNTVSGGRPPYTFSVAPGSALPPGLQLVSGPGLIGYNVGSTLLGGMPSTPGQFAFDLIVTDAGGSQVRRTFTLNVTPVGLVSNLAPTITVGQSFSGSYAAVGGTPPYTFTIEPVGPTQDMLPPGVSMTPDGVLSGGPTSTGSYAFWLTVQDAAGWRLRRQVTFTVNTATGLRVTTVNPGDAWVGGYLLRSLATNLTTSTYTWSLAGGSLPPGVGIVRGLVPTSPNTTYLTGAPAAPGTYTFTLRASADSGTTGSADHTFTCRVGSAQIVSPPWVLANILDIPGAEAGAPYTFTLAAAGANPPYTFAPTPFDPLPPGLSLSAAGVLSGTPQSPGAYSISAVVTDGAGYTNLIGGLTLIVAPAGIAPPLIRSGSLIGPASVGVPYGYGLDIMLRGGTPPFSWTVTPGSSLPPGMKLLPGSNGVPAYLGGTPTTTGSYSFYLTTDDAAGQTLSALYGLTVADLAILPDAPPPAFVGAAYSHVFVPSGGTAPYSIGRSYASDLPPGLTFASGGVLSGTPTSAGIYSIRFLVTDAAGKSLTRSIPIFVDDAAGQSPAVTVSPRPVQVFHDVGAAAPAPVPVTVATSSGALPAALSVAGIPGASLSATSGATPFGSSLSFNTSSLGAGVYTGIVAAAAPGTANLGDWAPVTLTVCAHTLFPLAGSGPASGGTGTFNVASGTTCGWTAVPSAPWITITGGASGTGNAAVSYSLAPNVSADPRTGTITVGGAVYTITQFGSACTYTIQPAAGSVPNSGGTGAFTVSTNGACGWTAVSSAAWLTVTGGAAGTGNATVTYGATPNTSPDARSATITVNGAMHTVTQFGTACSFAISPAGVTATAAGGTAAVLLSASSSQCVWSASSFDLGVTPASGSGTTTLQVAVPANTLPESRWLSATIAGQAFSVYQTGISCLVSLSSSSASVPAGASAGSVDVMTAAGCSYDTVLGPSWITVTSGASGVGPGTLAFTVEPNSTTYERSGTLTTGGQAFAITQAPLACSVTLNTAGLGSPFGPAAATGLIALTTNGPNCSWTASSDASWAAVTPPGGLGNATLTVTVTSNALSTVGRTGALTIAGQTVGLSQAGTACTFALESSSAAASASGGSASVRVIAPSVCGWTSSSNASWLAITSSGSSGSSAVSFTVAPNPSATPRSGTLTVAGLTYTVSQAGAPCSYSITGPASSPLLSAGGASGETFAFAATTTGCTPAAVSYSSWITITATNFGGTAGSVTYSVAPNAFGTTRTGTIQVGNALFTVAQSGADCAYSLNAYGKVFRVAGGTDTLLGSPTATGCMPDYGTDQPSFITLGDLTGPVLNIFSLPYEVSPFTTSLTAVVRVGRITFGGQILTIKQLSW